MRQMEAGLRWATLTLVGCAVIAACQPGEDSATIDTGLGTGAAGTTYGGMNEQQALGTIMAVHASEVQMGQLGQEKATNARVRQFAQRIAEEHQAFMQRQQGLPTQGDTAQADRQLVQMADSTIQRLRAMERGAAFDTAFVNAQVMAHEAALQRLDQMAGGNVSAGAGQTTGAAGDTGARAGQTPAGQAGQPASTSEYVSNTRQLIQQHLEAARQLQQQIGGNAQR